MPQLKQPSTLLNLVQKQIETIIISRSCSNAWIQHLGEIIPQSIAEEVLENLCSKHENNNSCYEDLKNLFNLKIKRLEFKLHPGTNDECLTSLLTYVPRCENLQKLFFSADVCKKFSDAVTTIIENIDCFPHLVSLVLQSCLNILDTPSLTLNLLTKLQKMKNLLELDLTEAKFDENCHKNLLKMKNFQILTLNNCKLSSIQVLQILTGLPRLRSVGKIHFLFTVMAIRNGTGTTPSNETGV